ncbi:MAG: ABC transporter substrate-binding protein [Brevibacillus sp.]|nr:ABC transporter substrate-binding protein [Brevibacillus sp.]
MIVHQMSGKALRIMMATLCLVAGCTDGQPASPEPVEHSSQPDTHPGEPTPGGQLVMAAVGSLPSFDPFGTAKQEPLLNPYESLAYGGLLAYDESGMPQANLASEFRIERTDGKPVVTVTLPPQAAWADGRPLTTEDVRFTLETYSRPDYYGIWREPTHLIEGVSRFRHGKAERISGIAVDPDQRTVRISLERDDITFLHLLTAPLLPKHQLDGKTPDEIAALSREGQILGTGMFQPQQMDDEAWTFAANGSYLGKKPLLESVKVIALPQEKVEEEVVAGRVHISPVSPEVAHLLRESGSDVKIISAAAHGYHFVGYNLASDKLKDADVRRALSQAVPVEQLARDLFYGFAQPAKSPLAPGTFAYVPGRFPSFDRDAAETVLKEKGYSRENPLSLTLVYPSGNQVRERMVEAVRAAWEKLPVRIEAKPLKYEEFAAYLFGGQPVDLYLYAWKYPTDPAGLIKVWHSRERVGELGLNASRYANSHADQLLERGQLMLSDAERKKLFVEWQQHFAADLPILPLVEVKNPYIISTRLQGAADQLGREPFRELGSWWLK